MTHSSHEWTAQLGSSGEAREQAIGELRHLLLKRLQRSFRDRPDLSSGFTEDIVQEALLKILDHLDDFQGRSQFTTWATTIAIRTAYSELRKKQWQGVSLERVLAEDNDRIGDPASPEVTPESLSDRAGLIEAMYEAIRQDLTAKQRDALLAELRGMPIEEIARRMESSRNAVYKLTHDARKRLKQHLEQLGYTSEDWLSMKA